MKRWALVCLLLLPAISFSQTTGAFTGRVTDLISGKPICDALIKVQKSGFYAVTDSSGKFMIKNVPVGTWFLEAIKFGYPNQVLPNQVITGAVPTFVPIQMATSAVSAEDVFYIGGIEVTAEKELLPDQPQTVTQIRSSEIEHIQATSLGDIMDLVPGTEMKNQPNLKEPVKAMIRDPRSTNRESAFGTKIIIDEIPISNNSNMQTGTLAGIQTNAGDGLDLREIPADNIESVEVIRGIAPAKYGDYVGGIVKVATKSKQKSYQRIKAKNNPDTREVSLTGATQLGQTAVNYTLGWGRSERDIRWENDHYHRLNAQFSFKNDLLDNRLKMNNSIYYYRTIDEVKIDPTDSSAISSYNRGYRLVYGHNGSFEQSAISKFDYNLFVTYRHINSYKQQRKVTQRTPMSILLQPGTVEAIIPDNYYIYKYTTTGDELSIGQKFEWERRFFTGSFFHTFSAGENFSFENNYGPGMQYDILKPSSAGDRPYSFDAVPGTKDFSIYLADRMTGKFYKEFTLDLGFRYESYNPEALFKSGKLFHGKNGTFFNPRINGVLYLARNTQLRAGYGASSKSPALNSIFPEPYYFDVLDLLPVYVTPDSFYYNRNALISTYVFSRSNPELQGYQEEKFEASLDQRIGNVGLVLTGYYSKRSDEPESLLHPFLYSKYIRPNWPQTGGEEVDTTFVGSYSTQVNTGWSKFSGCELTLETKTFKKLQTSFKFNVAYSFVRSGSELPMYGSIRQKTMQIPVYKSTESWTEKLILTYQANYLSKPLGIWVTLTAQQVPLHNDKTLGYADTLAIGYWDGYAGQFVSIPEADRMNTEFDAFRLQRADYEWLVEERPNKWIFNVKVSKSLYKGAEVSLFVNNVFDDRALYRVVRSSTPYYQRRNPEIFYGVEFSMLLDEFFHK